MLFPWIMSLKWCKQTHLIERCNLGCCMKCRYTKAIYVRTISTSFYEYCLLKNIPKKYLYICNNSDKMHLLGILLLICIGRVFLGPSQKYKVNYWKICLNLCHISRSFKMYLPIHLDKWREFISISHSGHLEIGFVSSESGVWFKGNYFWLFARNYISLQYLRVHLSAKTDLPNTSFWFLPLVSSVYQEVIITWMFCVQIPTQHYSL